MKQETVNLKALGVPEEELFSLVTHSDVESEKITAPRYSYWQSVFRVFFKKKINLIVLGLLAVIILFAFVYPMLIEYDRFANLTDATAKHLTPTAAMAKFGSSIHWILGAGASGEPTFDAKRQSTPVPGGHRQSQQHAAQQDQRREAQGQGLNGIQLDAAAGHGGHLPEKSRLHYTPFPNFVNSVVYCCIISSP